MKYKQAIVLNTDLEMSKGKSVAQACHASLEAYKKADKDVKNNWSEKGQKKVILSKGDESLRELHTRAKHNKLPAHLVKDAGRTELKPGTKTAVSIGPAEESEIDNITGQLELIK